MMMNVKEENKSKKMLKICMFKKIVLSLQQKQEKEKVMRTIEEKAKAYDKALAIARDFYNSTEYAKSHTEVKATYEAIFPELKESEDERIRKAILELVKQSSHILNPMNQKSMIAWLEGQGSDISSFPKEQQEFMQKYVSLDKVTLIKLLAERDTNTAEIIESFEKQGEQKFEQKFFINDKVVHKATGKIWTIHHYLKDTNSYYVEDNDGLLHHYRENELKLVEQKPANWFQELEDKLANATPQQLAEWKEKYFKEEPAEWSEDDLKMLDEMYEFFDKHKIPSLKHNMDDYAKFIKSLKDRVQPQQEWSEEEIEDCAREAEDNNCIILAEHIRQLKSLKQRYTWKPSEEQMKCLDNVKGSDDHNGYVLNTLYNDLKKLREE